MQLYYCTINLNVDVKATFPSFIQENVGFGCPATFTVSLMIESEAAVMSCRSTEMEGLAFCNPIWVGDFTVGGDLTLGGEQIGRAHV